MLNGAGDAERDVELRRDSLTGAADLPVHRQPAGVADRPRRGELRAERLREILRDLEVFLPLDSAPDRDDPLGLRKVDRLLCFLERRLRLLPDGRHIECDIQPTNRGRRVALRHGVGAEGADLERHEVWCGPAG